MFSSTFIDDYTRYTWYNYYSYTTSNWYTRYTTVDTSKTAKGLCAKVESLGIGDIMNIIELECV